MSILCSACQLSNKCTKDINSVKNSTYEKMRCRIKMTFHISYPKSRPHRWQSHWSPRLPLSSSSGACSSASNPQRRCRPPGLHHGHHPRPPALSQTEGFARSYLRRRVTVVSWTGTRDTAGGKTSYSGSFCSHRLETQFSMCLQTQTVTSCQTKIRAF